MERVFSLGLDYENQRAYDKVTGKDLMYENLGGGGNLSSHNGR